MTIESVADTLYWDQVAMMPEGGSSRRAEQLAVLNVLSHELLTAPQTNDWLAEVDEADLSSFEAANLREMRRKHLHATALEPDLVAAMSRNSTVCEAKWREARSGENFKLVAPLLAETVHLAREAAAAKSERLGVSPYEALMDAYEPGLRTADVEAIFDEYISFLPDFLARVLDHQRSGPSPLEPRGFFSIAAQRALAHEITEYMGFDFRRGRLDESLHPVCMGRGEDVRITTRYRENEPISAIMVVMHEAGHAIY